MTPDALCNWLSEQYPGTSWGILPVPSFLEGAQEFVRAESTGGGAEAVLGIVDGQHITVGLLTRAGRQTFSVGGYNEGLLVHLVHVPELEMVPAAVGISQLLLERGHELIVAAGLVDDLDFGTDA